MFVCSVNALFLSVENMLPNQMIWKNFIELSVNNFISCRLFVKSHTIHVVNAVTLMQISVFDKNICSYIKYMQQIYRRIPMPKCDFTKVEIFSPAMKILIGITLFSHLVIRESSEPNFLQKTY